MVKEFNIAVVGEVDAGKSSFIGVVSTNKADDGRGSARLSVLTLKHEKETGRTSNINTVIYDLGKNRIRFLDLAGHEKYLGTTLQGLTRYAPDMALLLIAANRGITPMTKEHFQICYSLKIPICIVVTKIDITPPDILKETLMNIKRRITGSSKHEKAKRHLYPVVKEKIVPILEAFQTAPNSILPLFKCSNTSLDGIDLIRDFLSQVNIHYVDDNLTDFMEQQKIKKLFNVYCPYYVDGIGYVVFGCCKKESIHKQDRLFIGPIQGKYQPVRIKSIHNSDRESVDMLLSGQTGCLALGFKGDFEPTKNLLKCTVVTDCQVQYERFIAYVCIFSHHSTITKNYNPYIHCCGVATPARVKELYKTEDQSEILPLMRTDDDGYIEFEFPRPYFIYPGAWVIFREGGIRGFGYIHKIL